MHNQQKTTNQNMVKVIGLGLIMILMAIAYFNKKAIAPTFGLPFDQVDSINSNKEMIPK